MKILFCGLGSIGRRHLINITNELKRRGEPFSVDALRHSDRSPGDEVAPLLSNSFYSFDELPDNYDVAFIANPSSEHYETLRTVAPRAASVFIEKPVFADPAADIGGLKLREDGVYYVACPLRFSPAVQAATELLRRVRPSSARAICSSFLPEWRSGADYRENYSAKRALGGGVRLDLVHEWDYLTELFGAPEQVASLSGHYSALEIDSDDTAVYIARYPDMLLSLHLDYTGRAPMRTLELFLENDTVVADILKNELRYLKSGETKQFAPVDVHRAEIDYFLDLVAGKTENINPIDRAMQTLRIAAG